MSRSLQDLGFSILLCLTEMLNKQYMDFKPFFFPVLSEYFATEEAVVSTEGDAENKQF